MIDFIIVVVVLALVGAAMFYIIKEKKRGVRCIGCPSAGSCSHRCSEAVGSGHGVHNEKVHDCHTDEK